MIYSLKESIKKYQDKIDNKLNEIKSDEEEKRKERIKKIILDVYVKDMKKLELLSKALDIALENAEEEKYKALEEKVEKRTVTYEDIKNIFQELKKVT